MAEITSQGQAITGLRRRSIEVAAVMLVGAAIAIAIAWAAFAASTSTAVTQTLTSVEYLQDPGLIDQRSGERGVVDATVPGGTLLDPAMQEHRRGEREGAK
jgi:flagellar biosynthesis/type III secretory pathway M-ring protein FliF/YscJ